MKRLDNIIKEVKEFGTNGWIFDDNGNIKNDVIVGNIFPYLEELRDYEIDVRDLEINYIIENGIGDNTYNYGANISNDFCWHKIFNKDTNTWLVAFMIHLSGDIRCNYTDYFVCEFEDEFEFMELDNVYQIKDIKDTEEVFASINIFEEGYELYDRMNDSLGKFYDVEVEDLMKCLRLDKDLCKILNL